jgi:hypothetical protein
VGRSLEMMTPDNFGKSDFDEKEGNDQEEKTHS